MAASKGSTVALGYVFITMSPDWKGTFSGSLWVTLDMREKIQGNDYIICFTLNMWLWTFKETIVV